MTYYNPPVTETVTVETCEYDANGKVVKRTTTTTTTTKQAQRVSPYVRPYAPYWWQPGGAPTCGSGSISRGDDGLTRYHNATDIVRYATTTAN